MLCLFRILSEDHWRGGTLPWTALSSNCSKTRPDRCYHTGQQIMWMLIDEIVCGKSTKTNLLYESTKYCGETGDYVGWSRLQDSPFNVLISEVFVFCSPNLSVLLLFWSASFGGIEDWEKQGGENGTMRLHHCSHRLTCPALQRTLDVLKSASLQPLTSVVFGMSGCELPALWWGGAPCNSRILVE